MTVAGSRQRLPLAPWWGRRRGGWLSSLAHSLYVFSFTCRGWPLDSGWVTTWQAQRELRINAERLRSDVRAARSHVPRRRNSNSASWLFELIDPFRALPLLTSLHYLRSARQDSLYFALVDPIDRLPVSLCSVSPSRMEVGFKIEITWRNLLFRPERVWDVSRVYSVDSAPPNAISLLLSKVRVYFRRNLPLG